MAPRIANLSSVAGPRVALPAGTNELKRGWVAVTNEHAYNHCPCVFVNCKVIKNYSHNNLIE